MHEHEGGLPGPRPRHAQKTTYFSSVSKGLPLILTYILVSSSICSDAARTAA